MNFRKTGNNAEQDVFDAGLFRVRDGDSIAVTTQAIGRPKNMDLFYGRFSFRKYLGFSGHEWLPPERQKMITEGTRMAGAKGIKRRRTGRISTSADKQTRTQLFAS